jgi:transcriptional regulator with XRE-family HTH domain
VASFGQRMRERREQHGVDLRTIANDTKIKLSLLEAMERDDVSHWPSGIFRRAYIRAYAHAIALDPDAVVREFVAAYPDPTESQAETVTDSLPRSPVALRSLLSSAFRPFSPGRGEPLTIKVEAAEPSASRVEPAPAEPPRPEPTEGHAAALIVSAAARVCTDLGQVEDGTQLAALVDDMARILGAVGIIVWVWDPRARRMMPTLTHGYAETVVAELPPQSADSDNAIGAAFRAGELCRVGGSDVANGALAAPLKQPGGCSGVLAVELPNGEERNPLVSALVTIFAAQLSTLVETAPAVTRDRQLA